MDSADDIIRQRSPSKWRSAEEYVKWFGETWDLVPTEPEFHLRKGRLLKPFLQEMLPLRYFVSEVYSDLSMVYCKPYLGNQPYDARIIDVSRRPVACAKIEFTEATDEEDYWRSRLLAENGQGPGTGLIEKAGTKQTGIEITAQPGAISYGAMIERAKKLLFRAARKKQSKSYGPNTWLVISFHVPIRPLFKKRHVDEIRTFVMEQVAPLVKTQKFFILFLSVTSDRVMEIPVTDSQ